MNRQLLTIGLALASLAVQAKKPRYMERPEWILSNAGKELTVTGVEFTDTATVVSFHSEYKPNNWIRIAAASTLTGDDGKKYAARHGIGITLAKRFYMPESGKADFKVSFEPMPRNTRFVDFSEGPDGWTVWGIHGQGTRLPKMKNDAPDDMRITDESTFFRRGTGVVRGRFTGKRPNIVEYYGHDPITHESNMMVFDVADDGTFTATIDVENPSIKYLLNKRAYYFYVAAGDTIDITIADDGTVTYPDDCKYARLLNLLSNSGADLYINNSAADAAAKDKSLAEFTAWMDKQTDNLMTAAEYIAMRYNLSPQELHMLKTQALLNCAIRFFDMAEKKPKEESVDSSKYTFIRRIPADDLSFLIFPHETYFLQNRYEYCPAMKYVLNENGTLGFRDEKTMADVDKAFYGSDKPSMLLQITWTNKQWLTNMYEVDSDKALNSIAERRKSATSPFIRAMLDKIKEELTAPKITAYTLPEGKATDIFRAITDKYSGKFVYIDFWGIYCGPCRSNIEMTQALRDSIATLPDVEMVFITSERESPKDKYEEYVAKNLKGEECYRLPDEDYNRLRGLFHFTGIPHHELVAPDGRIMSVDVRRHLYMNFEMFKFNIEKMKQQLANKPQ